MSSVAHQVYFFCVLECTSTTLTPLSHRDSSRTIITYTHDLIPIPMTAVLCLVPCLLQCAFGEDVWTKDRLQLPLPCAVHCGGRRLRRPREEKGTSVLTGAAVSTAGAISTVENNRTSVLRISLGGSGPSSVGSLAYLYTAGRGAAHIPVPLVLLYCCLRGMV